MNKAYGELDLAGDVQDVPVQYWGVLVVLAACVITFSLYFVRLLYEAGAIAKPLKRAAFVAVQSSVVFIGLISTPLVVETFVGADQFNIFLDKDFLWQYQWLPFWYAFLLSKYLGEYFDAAWHSIIGTGFALIIVIFLNYLMPGGASPFSKEQIAIDNAWWPGGYSQTRTIFFSVLLVGYVFTSTWSVTFKQYCLGFYATCVVPFMDPTSEADSWEAVIFSYDGRVRWTGPVVTSVYVIAVAVPLAGLSIVLCPCCQRNRKFFSCTAVASKACAHLAQDTMGALERIVTYFLYDQANFDIESTWLYLRKLGRQHNELEAMLEQGRWECYDRNDVRRINGLVKLSRFLRSLRQILHVLLQQLKNSSVKQATLDDIGRSLDCFLGTYGNAFDSLSKSAARRHNFDQVVCASALELNTQADEALLQAIKELDADPGSRLCNERAFIDSLRSCCSELNNFLNVVQGERHESTKDTLAAKFKLYLFPTEVSADRFKHGLRNLTSWTLALLWCIFYRNYNSACLATVSFVFSPNLGSLFDKSMNRMVGVGLGLILGNLPAVFLKDAIKVSGENFESVYGVALYMAVMMLFWGIAVYGYLAPRPHVGANWSYACLLWAGFGGCQMLRPLIPSMGPSTRSEHRSELFHVIMDNFLGCIIVLIVDLCFAKLFGSRVTDEIATTLPLCLENVATMVRSFRSEGTESELDNTLTELRQNIATGLYWDDEITKIDLVWNGRLAAYKEDLVAALLEKLDSMCVVLWSIRASSERIGQANEAARILREVFPDSLADQCMHCAHVVQESLKIKSKETHQHEDVGDSADVLNEIFSMPSARAIRRSFSTRVGPPNGGQGSAIDRGIRHNFSSVGTNGRTFTLVSPLNLSNENGIVVDNEGLKLKDIAEEAEADLVKAHLREIAQSEYSAGAWAAATTVRSEAWTLRRIILQVVVLLQEHSYWRTQYSTSSNELELVPDSDETMSAASDIDSESEDV